MLPGRYVRTIFFKKKQSTATSISLVFVAVYKYKSVFQIMICYFVAFRMPCIYRRQLSNLDRCSACYSSCCFHKNHLAACTLFFAKKKKRKLIFHFLPLLFSRGDRRLDYRCAFQRPAAKHLSATHCQAPAWLGRILFLSLF